MIVFWYEKELNSNILKKKSRFRYITHVVTELDKLYDEEYSIIIDYLSKLQKERKTKKGKQRKENKESDTNDKKVNKPSFCPNYSNQKFILEGNQSGKQRLKCIKCKKKIYNERKQIPFGIIVNINVRSKTIFSIFDPTFTT